MQYMNKISVLGCQCLNYNITWSGNSCRIYNGARCDHFNTVICPPRQFDSVLAPIINPVVHKRKGRPSKTHPDWNDFKKQGACNHSAHNLMLYITDKLVLPVNLSYCNILINFIQGHNFRKGPFKLPDTFCHCVVTLQVWVEGFKDNSTL